MANTVPGVVKNKIDTASNLASWAVAPLSGELVIESDTKKFKYGDGSTLYTALPYGKSLPTTNTSTIWTSSNPTLLNGEWGKETDTGKMKNGDGVTAWTSLGYSVISDIDTVLDSKASISSPQLSKAWVNFNGTGTISIRDSFNVSSIIDNGVGSYTCNFINNMADNNYSVGYSGPAENAGGAYNASLVIGNSGADNALESFEVRSYLTNSGGQDASYITAYVFGS